MAVSLVLSDNGASDSRVSKPEPLFGFTHAMSNGPRIHENTATLAFKKLSTELPRPQKTDK